MKGRALKIHTASSKGSLAQELCLLTHIRRSPSAAAACLQLPPFPADPTGGCHICSPRLPPTARCGDMVAELCLPRACSGGRDAVVQAQGDAAQKHSGCSHPARPAAGLCLGSRRFGQRHVEGESCLESVWAGEMGVWV